MVRRIARTILPARTRLALRLARRALADRQKGTAFASRRGMFTRREYEWACYERPFLDYPGQERFAEAKRRNQAILASFLDGTVIFPGEVFSVWKLAPRPCQALGYGRAAALHGTTLTSDVGGAICLLSTVLYNVALLAGLDIVERHGHGVDNYGPERYFEPGRDAAIEWGYQDLRFRNPHAVVLRLQIAMDHRRIWASLWAEVERSFDVEIRVTEPTPLRVAPRVRSTRRLASGEMRCMAPETPGFRVQTLRIIRYRDGSARHDDLGPTQHQPLPAVIQVGRGR